MATYVTTAGDIVKAMRGRQACVLEFVVNAPKRAGQPAITIPRRVLNDRLPINCTLLGNKGGDLSSGDRFTVRAE